MRCVIFANGEINNYNHHKKYLKDSDYIICVDGGARHAEALKIIPQMLIGDFDSIAESTLEKFLSAGSQVKRYPPEKDQVDTELAIIEAIKLKPEQILLMGVLGDRLDHTLANIQLLVIPAAKEIECCIISDCHMISLIMPEHTAVIEGKPGDLLSLLPLTQTVQGVNSYGLKWNLHDSVFTFNQPLGISNVLQGESAWVKIKAGIMLLIKVFEPDI
ncbi:thiamine pyrophosphokinase [Desulfofarcimen acetoxidans DSM 771]|uniref:Thiamine diphosphokinase n=1 Tax=Desulfofarcimen acetoxidans (strain ATCC 49208 / DSM 771 / KCTC 5769 / VKM B-1644 / 5575) TaxID=485916 RepID=C8VXJ2_DESAS|nr:thiamine diphosphokinase [Desulfofarcimen acetoxidans]ACV62648.1 thiamine pyrophosphokinase [Desulfofarcimen acetoxidans DSM 771]